MSHIHLTISVVDAEKAEILIALLSEEGFHGFEQTEDTLHAFIAKDDYSSQIISDLIIRFGVEFASQEIEMRNWNSEWESNFKPVEVLDQTGNLFALIRAPFHPERTDALYELLIQPKMSFGTGHHATTALMVAGMAELDFNGKSVIDFGTGTGILAILAEKMGATNILAIDCDDWSIENTGENIMANDCNKIKLIKAGQFPKHQKADIILANINLNVILDNLDTLTAAVLPGGSVLFSGILHHDEAVLKAELHKYHIENVTVRQKGDWSMLQVGSIAT